MSAQHTARIVALTKPVEEEISCSNSQELLAYFARVSNAANQDNHLTGAKLIRRLIKDNEWSPLDMVSINFEINTSRRIARQILRHWSMRFQEFSQRWSVVKDEYYLTPLRYAVPGRRAETTPSINLEEENNWYKEQIEIWDYAWKIYDKRIKAGVHPEVACVILPEGMAASRLYVQATLRTWIHYCLLRMKHQTQIEHRRIALQIQDALSTEFPILLTIFENEK